MRLQLSFCRSNASVLRGELDEPPEECAQGGRHRIPRWQDLAVRCRVVTGGLRFHCTGGLFKHGYGPAALCSCLCKVGSRHIKRQTPKLQKSKSKHAFCKIKRKMQVPAVRVFEKESVGRRHLAPKSCRCGGGRRAGNPLFPLALPNFASQWVCYWCDSNAVFLKRENITVA